jgi:hypothetical protein
MALMLGVSRLLVMAKDTSGLPLIIISEMFFQLINHSKVLQLSGPFQKHLSPHQFEISTPRSCEAIPFGIRTLFDLHLDWAILQVNFENTFNNVF